MIIISVDLTPAQKNTYKKCKNYPDKLCCIRLSKNQINVNDAGEYNLNLTDLEFRKLYKAISSKNPRGVEIDISNNKIFKNVKKESIDKLLFPIRPLSNFDIDKYFVLQNINGICVAKDNLPKSICNLNDQNQGGSHWVALVNKRNTKFNLYFDSFGIVYPPQNILDKYKNKPLICSEKKIQQDDSVLCGYYCLRIINDILNKNMSYKKAIDQFTKNPSKQNQDLALNLI
jgi:hypothetical protein